MGKTPNPNKTHVQQTQFFYFLKTVFLAEKISFYELSNWLNGLDNKLQKIQKSTECGDILSQKVSFVEIEWQVKRKHKIIKRKKDFLTPGCLSGFTWIFLGVTNMFYLKTNIFLVLLTQSSLNSKFCFYSDIQILTLSISKLHLIWFFTIFVMTDFLCFKL